MLFFTFVFFRFINSGYVLVVFPPICAWVAGWASDWYRNAALFRAAKPVVIAIAAAVNIGIFLEAPLYCSYRSGAKLRRGTGERPPRLCLRWQYQDRHY